MEAQPVLAGRAVLVAPLGGGAAPACAAARGAVGASTQGEGGELGVIDCFDAATDRDYWHVTLLTAPFFALVQSAATTRHTERL